MDYYVKDISLAEKGKKAVEISLMDMPGLEELARLYEDKKPLNGIKITGCVIVTYETAAFILLLKKLGADLRWCSDNKYASLDDACAFVASKGIPIFATSELTDEKYEWCFEQAAKFKDKNGNTVWPDITIDDGCDITRFLHEKYPEAYETILGTCEQTTCGVNAHYNLKGEKRLNTAVINVNESVTKSKFDNIYGSRESLIEGLQSSINLQIGGKKTVIYGYGEVGKGCAKVLRGLGANVHIVEIDPIIAMQAYMEGFSVVNRNEAAEIGEIFVTATGCVKTVAREDLQKMNDGAVLMNMGHGNMEIDTDYLLRSREHIVEKISDNLQKITLSPDKRLYLLAEGYLVNLVGGDGHPPRVMSITYTNHILAILDLLGNKGKYKKGEIYRLPRELDEKAARLNFPGISGKLTILTDEQEKYLGVKKTGPYKREDYRY
ncbi:adenosylhomocysteinase [Candidatus Woesebacteria bacterium]|nr:MAG: adenosylhomocysteinase [Candidatus Woesebacteria bacterium]